VGDAKGDLLDTRALVAALSQAPPSSSTALTSRVWRIAPLVKVTGTVRFSAS
jgi:hypothetical protein